MAVQWGDLAGADLGPLETLRDQWRGYVDRLEEYGNVLAEDVAKHLGEDVFEGDDAVAARARLDRFQTAVTGDVLDRAAAIRDALADQHDALKGELDRHESITTEAGNAGLSIAADGWVSLARPEQTVMGVEETEAQQQLIIDTAAAAAACVEAFALADAQLAAALNAAWEVPSELPMPIGENPEMQDIPTGPEHVADWWAGLDPMERDAYLEAFPDLLGGLDGMPADARNTANEATLEREVDALDAEVDSLERQLADMDARGVPEDSAERLMLQEELAAVQAKHDEAKGLQTNIATLEEEGKDVYLLDYSLEGDGQAVVSIGNPDTADNTAVHVPGTYSELSNFGTQMNRADTMYEDALKAAPDEETAVIAWLGYDAPDSVPQASNPQQAHDATGDLSSFMYGLEASHQGGDSHTSVMGHSYGSTVAGDTVRTYEGVADELITVASPGTSANSVEELNIDEDHVWSTTAEGDAIELPQDLGLLGHDATNDGFGGNEFTSDAVGADGGQIHGGYWRDVDENGDGEPDRPNEARSNIANIITGNTDKVGLVE
ncbi:alpha/beta hydrolase [Glycomyces paridis]|uniref:DUF1023 domain-containing protein n=1 Tax=Glycomyces paridis TaxID=2126555 RepID=A0A4S8PCB5_9ACTN|nr:alpha/beta hydrolase [Glycomyces paridis]THV26792.1 hypothetical protein E9998_17560 [Glycomyces paridis]